MNGIPYEIQRAKNKNDFPDLKLTIDGVEYALEHKAAMSDNGPNNDLGTLNAYPCKIEQYGDNILCTFVKYSRSEIDDSIIINNVYFDKIYRFVGQGFVGDNLLKYKKKDGYLRPKVWSAFDDSSIYFDTLHDFENALERTITYRTEQLVVQYIGSLSNESLEKMKKYIDSRLDN